MRARLGTIAVLCCVVLTGCAGGGSSAPTSAGGSPASHQGRFEPTRRDFEAIARALGRRARAVRAHDLTAFLATVDRSDSALVAQQKTLYANLTSLPLLSLHYAIDKVDALVPARVPGNDPVLHPEITEFVQLSGSLERPVTNAVDETYVERGTRWVLGAEPADQHEVQWRPWGGPPIAALRQGEMTVITDRSRASSLPALAGAIHDDIAFDAAHLGVPASYRVVVDATSTGGATTFSAQSKEEAAAVTFGLVEGTLDNPASGGRLAGLAIKVNPHESAQIAASTPVLRHELTHYLLRSYSGSSPTWLSEGIATWIQYYPDSFSALQVSPALYTRLLHADRTLPSVGLFDVDPDVNYTVSQAAVAWLVTHYGMARLLALMQAYRTHYRDANVDALTPRLLHLVYGVSEQQVVTGAFALVSELQH